MSSHEKEAGSSPQVHEAEEGGGMRHGVLAMIACCVPMVAILALIAFKVI